MIWPGSSPPVGRTQDPDNAPRYFPERREPATRTQIGAGAADDLSRPADVRRTINPHEPQVFRGLDELTILSRPFAISFLILFFDRVWRKRIISSSKSNGIRALAGRKLSPGMVNRQYAHVARRGVLSRASSAACIALVGSFSASPKNPLTLPLPLPAALRGRPANHRGLPYRELVSVAEHRRNVFWQSRWALTVMRGVRSRKGRGTPGCHAFRARPT